MYGSRATVGRVLYIYTCNNTQYIYSFNNSFLEAESKTVTAAPQWSDTITKINLPKYKHKRINTNTGGEIQTQNMRSYKKVSIFDYADFTRLQRGGVTYI